MGATKRLSELCMQGIYEIDQQTNKFFNKIFGNVSVSVSNSKFKQQQNGGLVTLTHNDVSQHFMTITKLLN